MSQITTHILDTAKGVPAQGIHLVLEAFSSENTWIQLAEGITNADGRVSDLLKTDVLLSPGIYRMTFETSAYFTQQGLKSFYPYVQITFEVSDPRHYHIPLLLSPYGFTTYRGS